MGNRSFASDFDVMLFAIDEPYVEAAESAGISHVIVDWEYAGKSARQRGADTEINQHTIANLRRVRAATALPVICRINRPGDETGREVEAAIDEGADELLVPMVETPAEVERVLALARGRCGVGMLVETPAAVARAADFDPLPLTRVYVGLNDLAIARRAPSIFQAVADGTVAHVRSAITRRFGFGGLTLPERGAPIPCRLLISELMRLGCSFSFLRRSFRRDVPAENMPAAVRAIRTALAHAAARDADTVAREHAELVARIQMEAHVGPA